MNYEHNDEFEQTPGGSQRDGAGRQPGQPRRKPARTSAGSGRPEAERGKRPVRREGARTPEDSGQPGSRGSGGDRGAGGGRKAETGRVPREAGDTAGQPGRPAETGRIPQAAGGTDRQLRKRPGTERVPREAGDIAGRPGRPAETGRMSQAAGGSSRQPGSSAETGRIPQAAGETGRQPGRFSGTGRMPGGARRGTGDGQPEGRAGSRAGRMPGIGSQEEETPVIREGRASGTGRPERPSDSREVWAGRAAERETAAAGEANFRENSVGTGRNRKTAGLKGISENPREALVQAKIQKAKKKRRTRRLIAMIVAECLMLTVIFTYAYFARRLNMIQRDDFNKEDVKNSELSLDDLTKMKGYWMIAVFGVDSRSTSVGAGSQADVNMICCINQDTGEIKLVSVYRDTYLNINDSNSYRKINAAYTNGGPEQALKALNKNLDLNITDYVTFSWKAVADGINILGGVDVEITRAEFRYINAFITETVKATNIGSHQLQAPGLQHLDGVQAVAYGRLRLMDTDYARTERQRKIIELAFAKAKQADYPTLNNILVTTLPSISTNLDFADLTSLALSIGKYHIGETAGFPFAKGNANMPGKGDCVIPQTLESNVSQLHTFLFGDESYTPTDQVKQISSKIAADSGMHREGKPSTGSALATDSYVPTETTAQRTTEAETPEETSRVEESRESHESETDENGNMILYPNQTDAAGNLIDAPIDDWPEEDPMYPGGQNSGQTGIRPQGPGNPGGTEGQNPGRPSESSGSQTPGTGTTPGSGSQPGSGQLSGGNAGGQTPGGNEGPGGSSGNTGLGTGGNSSSGITPAGNTSPGNAGSGNSSSGGNSGESDGPGFSQQPSGGQTPSQPSQGGQTPGQPSQGGQTPGQPSQSGQTPGQPSQEGQTSGPQSPSGQSSTQPDNSGGPGVNQGPGL